MSRPRIKIHNHLPPRTPARDAEPGKFVIQWRNAAGFWKATPGPTYASRKEATSALAKLGLSGNPEYRVIESGK